MENPDRETQSAFRGLRLTKWQKLVFVRHLRGMPDTAIANELGGAPARIALHRESVVKKLLNLPDKQMRKAIIRHFPTLVKLGASRWPEPSQMVKALANVLKEARQRPIRPLTERQEIVLLLHFAGVHDVRIARWMGLCSSTISRQRLAGMAKMEEVLNSRARMTRATYHCLLLLDYAQDPAEYRRWAGGDWADKLLVRADIKHRRLLQKAEKIGYSPKINFLSTKQAKFGPQSPSKAPKLCKKTAKFAHVHERQIFLKGQIRSLQASPFPTF